MLKHIEIMLSLACITNTERPSAMHGGMSFRPVSRVSFLSLSTVFLPRRNARTHTQDTACDITVATAAPLTPMLSAKINRGSSTMFNTAPMSTVYMPVLAKPCAVMKAFRPSVICTKIVPRAYMLI